MAQKQRIGRTALDHGREVMESILKDLTEGFLAIEWPKIGTDIIVEKSAAPGRSSDQNRSGLCIRRALWYASLILSFSPLMKTSWNLSKYSDLAHLVLRLAVAAAFLYHGTMKFGFLQGAAPEGMSDTLVMIFKFLAIAEPLAGVALIIGLLTQVAAAGLALVMVCAIYFKASGGFDFWQSRTRNHAPCYGSRDRD